MEETLTTRGDVLIALLEALRRHKDQFWEEMRQRHEEEQARRALQQVPAVAIHQEQFYDDGEPAMMKLVLIEWRDSYGCSADWQLIDGVSPKPLICKSVGWLAYDGDECKLVIPHISGDHPNARKQGCGDMTIPTSAVISMLELRTA